MADKKKSWKNIVTPVGATYGQLEDAYKQAKKYVSGKDPESAPMPAKEHKDKAKKLGTKSGKAIKKATKNY